MFVPTADADSIPLPFCSTKSNQCPLEEPVQLQLPKALPQPPPLGSTRHRTALREVSSNSEDPQSASVQPFEVTHRAHPYVPSRKSPLRRTMLSHHWEETLHNLPSTEKRQKEFSLGKDDAGGKEPLKHGVSRADPSQVSKQSGSLGQSKSAYGASAAVQPADRAKARGAPIDAKTSFIAPQTFPSSVPTETPNGIGVKKNTSEAQVPKTRSSHTGLQEVVTSRISVKETFGTKESGTGHPRERDAEGG
jgi:hypothetical protein